MNLRIGQAAEQMLVKCARGAAADVSEKDRSRPWLTGEFTGFAIDLPEEGVGTVSRVTDHRRRRCHGLQQDRRLIDIGLSGPVKVQASGLPGASAIMWILVPQPPRDRPSV